MASSGSEGQMVDRLRFWFDLTSPYAWLAFDELYAIAEAAGREVELKPVLLWAILKEQGLSSPMARPAREAYMRADMRRSAAYLGLPLVLPEPFQISTHLAARLAHGFARDRPEQLRALVRRIFVLRFVEGQDIAQLGALQGIAAEFGLEPAELAAMTAAPDSRDALAAANAEAVAQGIWGVPFFQLGGEGFFGADRLPQLRWRLGL